MQYCQFEVHLLLKFITNFKIIESGLSDTLIMNGLIPPIEDIEMTLRKRPPW